jgi:hypothetical protein
MADYPTKTQLENLKEALELQKALTDAARDRHRIEDSSNTSLNLQKETAALQQQREALTDIVKKRRENSAELKEQVQLTQEELTYIRENNKLRKFAQEYQEALLQMKKEESAVATDQLRIAQQALAAEEAKGVAGEEFYTAVTKARDALKQAKEEMEGTKKGQEGLNKAATKGKGIFTSIVSRIISVATEAFNAQKAFERAFQMPDAYTEQLSDLHEQLAETGVSMTDLTQATGDLITNVTDFTLASEGQRRALQQTTAQLNELGVASADVGSGVQSSMKFFGQSMEGAERTARELFVVAKELQVVPGEMAAQYAAMGPQLAKFGQEGISTFKELSRIQKLTGMEMGKLIQIASKFDTFEGAAEATGKLNAALGGNFVNAMDMMMDTDPASRFDTIRGAIEQAGLSFDTMSYYQKQFYTEALGLSDVGDLALMLSGRTDLMTGATQQGAASYEEMAERSKKVMNITEQFNAMIAENADEIIELMHGVQGLVAGLAKFAGIIKVLIPIMVAYKGYTAMLALGNMAIGVSSAFAAKGSKRMLRGILPLVAALVLLAVVGLQMMSPSKVVIALMALGVTLYFVSKALAKAAPSMGIARKGLTQLSVGLWSVILPISLLLAAVAIVAAGIGYMAEGFAKMFEAIDIEKAKAMGIFMLSMAASALILQIAGLGMAILAAGLFAVGFALKFIATDDLTAIATIMESIAKIPPGNFSNSASGIRSIAKAIDQIWPWGADSLLAIQEAFVGIDSAISGAAGSLQSLVASMAQITPEAAAAIGTAFTDTAEALDRVPITKTPILTKNFEAMDLAARSLAPLSVAFAGRGAPPLTAGAASRAAATGGSTPAAGGSQHVKVDVEFNDPMFTAKVKKIMGKEYS